MLVKLDHFPNFRGENLKKNVKPPPSNNIMFRPFSKNNMLNKFQTALPKMDSIGKKPWSRDIITICYNIPLQKLGVVFFFQFSLRTTYGGHDLFIPPPNFMHKKMSQNRLKFDSPQNGFHLIPCHPWDDCIIFTYKKWLMFMVFM